MPPWASAAIAVAPWAAVAVVATLVAGRIVDKVLDIVKLRVLGSPKTHVVVHRSRGEETVWLWPDTGTDRNAVQPPPARPLLRSIDKPAPPSRSG